MRFQHGFTDGTVYLLVPAAILLIILLYVRFQRVLSDISIAEVDINRNNNLMFDKLAPIRSCRSYSVRGFKLGNIYNAFRR